MLAGRSCRPAALRAWQQRPLDIPHRDLHLRGLHGLHGLAFSARHAAAPARFAGRRPQAAPAAAAASGRRWEVSTTGDDQSGHIAAKPGEGILFLDNVFPLRIGNVLAWRPWRTSADYDGSDLTKLLKRFSKPANDGSSSTAASDSTSASASASASTPSTISSRLAVSVASVVDPVGLVRQALPDDLGLTITEIVPRLKDGGVFVKFRHPAGLRLDDVEARLAKRLLADPVRPWFNPLWGCMRAGLVRGVPWLEDLASRVPSSRVRVEFCAPPPPDAPPPGTAGGLGAGVGVGDATGSANLELSQETLYSLFRRYGKIAEISSQPFESKTLPRYATIDFMRIRDAVMARSCLHGFVVHGTTRLRLSYEARVRAHHIWDWLTSHPRIVIPILAALLATITVAVFDPIRAFFIRAHVQHSFALRDSRLWKWVQLRTSAFVNYARTSYDAAADNMGIGSGGSGGSGSGRGSGRTRGQDALMTHRRDLLEALRTWLLETTETFIVVQGPRGSGKNELVIDQALHGRRDVLVIDCKPIVEAHGESATIKRLAAAIGYRPVFSWANNVSSLVDLAVQGTTGVKTGFSETLDEQLSKILQTATTALRDVGLAARHKADADAHLNDDAYLEAHPERRPVIVLDNFGHRNEDATGLVYDKLAEWAATLVQANIAHVVFLTSDTSYPKALLKAMPDRVFRQIALGDLAPPVAMNYVLSHLAQKDEVDDEDDTTSPPTDDASSADKPAAAAVAAAASPAPPAAEPKKTSILDKVGLSFQKKDGKEEEAQEGKDVKDGKDIKDGKEAVAAAGAAATNPDAPAPSAALATGSASPSRLNTGAAKAVLATAASSGSGSGSGSGGPTGVNAASTAVAAGVPVAAAAAALSGPQADVIRELESCIGVLGGRLTDLESLVRRLKSGQTPTRAVSEIVEQSASEIIKMFLLASPKSALRGGAAASSSGAAASPGSTAASGTAGSSGGRAWTAEQAWYLVRQIAEHGSVCYNDVLLSDPFASSTSPAGADGIAAIDALAAAELVTVRSVRGRPQTIKAGSPVYLAAFRQLGSDRALAARLDRSVLAERVRVESQTVAKVEQELALLGSLPRQPAQTSARVTYLLGKLQAAQAKIVAYETEMGRLKKAMSEGSEGE